MKHVLCNPSFCSLLALVITGCTCVQECDSTSKKALAAKVGKWKLLFQRETIGDQSTTVFVRGTGQPILLMHELPGLTPDTVELAMDLSRNYRVYMPLFFGEFGGRLSTDLQAAVSFYGSEKWKLLDPNDLGPIRKEMKSLVHELSARNGGRKVVVIGNCLTGTIPFELLAESCVDKAVVCQPAVPILPWSSRKMAMEESTIQRVVQRIHENPTKHLYIFHYYGDRAAPIERSAEMVRRITSKNGTYQASVFLAIEPETKIADGLFPDSIVTEIIVPKDSGHSTITGASPDEVTLEGYRKCKSDREVFRSHLKAALKS